MTEEQAIDLALTLAAMRGWRSRNAQLLAQAALAILEHPAGHVDAAVKAFIACNPRWSGIPAFREHLQNYSRSINSALQQQADLRAEYERYLRDPHCSEEDKSQIRALLKSLTEAKE